MTTPDFRELAREFCREKEFSNVDLIELAMQRAADRVLTDVTALVRDERATLVAHRERTNRPT